MCQYFKKILSTFISDGGATVKTVFIATPSPYVP